MLSTDLFAQICHVNPARGAALEGMRRPARLASVASSSGRLAPGGPARSPTSGIFGSSPGSPSSRLGMCAEASRPVSPRVRQGKVGIAPAQCMLRGVLKHDSTTKIGVAAALQPTSKVETLMLVSSCASNRKRASLKKTTVCMLFVAKKSHSAHLAVIAFRAKPFAAVSNRSA